MRMITVLAFLFISSIAFAGTVLAPIAESKAPVGQEQQSAEANIIKATAGKEFIVTLDANATTGYEWQIANQIDDSLISFVSAEYIPEKIDLIGAGGKSIWTFKAVQAGTTQISFKYIRPWEKDVPPVREATYIVDIQE